MKPCRDCQSKVSEDAFACPQCGAPYPAREEWDGWGFEYKSSVAILGLALLHISFKYRPNVSVRDYQVAARGATGRRLPGL